LRACLAFAGAVAVAPYVGAGLFLSAMGAASVRGVALAELGYFGAGLLLLMSGGASVDGAALAEFG
jgi:hypothetical protein